jgi:hypothetical protein
MHGLQGMFPRCKKCLPSDPALSHLVIKAIVLVHNFRNDYVGYSQIQTVFDTEYVRVENLQGYDQIAQYYFHQGEYNSEVDGEADNDDDDSD